jgi:hypothetical protein
VFSGLLDFHLPIRLRETRGYAETGVTIGGRKYGVLGLKSVLKGRDKSDRQRIEVEFTIARHSA